jgi:hypothetical protein
MIKVQSQSAGSSLSHFRFSQMAVFSVVTALGMGLLISRASSLQSSGEYGLFFATMVVLVHWHFGATFVLLHFGPASRLSQALLESLILFALLANSILLKNPSAWFGVNALAYFVAYLRYRGAGRLRLSPALRTYLGAKSLVELMAVAACMGGGAFCLLWPSYGAPTCWLAFAVNLAVALYLSEVRRLYDLAPAVAQR